MTWPYNPAIPNPPNDPADDVPGMQINASSIASLIDIDHVGFNVAGGGQHEQVTFNSNNVPSVFPVSPPIEFTNAITGGNNGLFFYSGSAVQSANQYVATGNGSTMLLGGIILKWGQASANGIQTITFPVAFPNNCFTVLVTATGGGGPTVDNGYVYINSSTATNFIAEGVRRITLAATGVTFNYIAIGN